MVPVALCVLGAGCAASPPPVAIEPVPPFHLRPTAWRLVLEETPELARDRAARSDSKSLARAMDGFYKVVTNHEEERDAKQRRARRRACNRGFTLLTQQMRRSDELRDPLLIARTYLAAECGLARKALPALRRFTKRRDSADFFFFAGHFWSGESYLALDRLEAAKTQFRWVLGELESPLYPLAMLRTAHCYWDDGEAEGAREQLEHLRQWIGDKTSPPWVRSLAKQVDDDLREFSATP